MNWKNRLKNYNFWISMFSAVLLILQALKLEFDVAYVNEIFTAVLGLLVVVGIIIDPTKTSVQKAENNTTKTEKNQSTEAAKPEEKVDEKEINSLPIFEESETDIVNNENDFKNVLNKIYEELQNKIEEINTLNKETSQCLKEIQNKEPVRLEEGGSSPVAAEMENPYFDLMK